MSRPDAGADRGAASLLVATCVALLLVIGAALGVVAALVRSHRAAQAAADLAALAGAEARQRGEDGCRVAAALARSNAAELVACRLIGDDVAVAVEVVGPRWLGQTADLTAQARAGPAGEAH